MGKRDWLKELRIKRGETTYSVAKEIGVSQSLYSALENGTRGVTVDKAKKIANFFGIECRVRPIRDSTQYVHAVLQSKRHRILSDNKLEKVAEN